MVAIITGKGAGLERSSGWVLGSQGQLGSASLGRGHDNVYVNAANGNLVVTRQDEFLIGRGPDVSLDRTYNSQAVAGVTDGDNDDQWRMGVYRRIDGANGNATIKRIDWDGSDTVYEIIGTDLYRTTDGSGAHDELAWDGTQWIWTDGDSQLTDVYDSTGKLLSSSDTDGNSLTYIYTGALITKVTGANGEHTDLVYSGTQLQQITTYGAGPTPTLVRVRYAYDLADRLATVTVDLSPNDRSINDSNTYVTSYTYEGDSNRIASISQQDGSRVSFTYVQVGADHRVASFTQTVETGVTRTTGFDYSLADRTTVTDPAGRNTILFYDAGKNLTQISYPPEEVGATPKVVQFGYDGGGNLTSATLGPGDVISYGYDTSGNLTSERDSAGNTITRTYGDKNELLSETKYLVPDPDGAGAGQPGTPLITRYAYDPANHLRYIVSPEGRVIQHNYNPAGQRTSTVEFTADTDVYTTAGVLDHGLLNDWAAGIGDKSTTRRIDMAYDFRGAVERVTSWSRLLPSGEFDTGSERSQTTYIYDQAGNLLTRQVTGSAGSEAFVYDGLNRTIMATDFNAAVTRTTFFDALGRTVIGHANGLSEISTYNRAGELIAYSRSNAGGNLVELSGWPADPGDLPSGNASVPGWLNHPYYNDETQWAATEGPSGLQVVAMQAGQQDPGAEGGGTYTNAVTIDSSKSYEFVYYFKLDTVDMHSIYFGTNLATTGAYVEDASTGEDATNPYFFARGYGQQSIFTADKWYKVVGYVLAEGAALVPQGSLGGVYDVETGEFVAATTGVYRWNAGRPDDRVYSRFFNFYNETVDGYSTYFYKPEIREVGAPIPVTPEIATSHYRYDNLGRLRMSVDPLGRATYMLYDAVGRKVADVDADGSVVEYRYDGSNRLSSTIRYATRLTAAELASLADFDSGGDGSSTTIGTTGSSHLVNGGFDDSGDPVSLPHGRSNTWLPGWTKANAQNFEQVAAGQLGVTGTTGAYWLDLDSVTGTGAPVQIGSNLITNGSFDQSGTYTALPHGRSNSTLPGWTKTNAENFEQVAAGQFGVTGATGAYWLDLDSYGAGSTRVATGANLLTNGSFESFAGGVKVQYGWTTNYMAGWTRIGPARFEVHGSNDPDVTASDGTFWLDLDSTYTDSSGGPPPEIMGQYLPFGGMATNQLINGSFEEVEGGNPESGHGYYGFALSGWENLSGVRADQVWSGEFGVDASDGGLWLDLDGPSGAAANLDIAQTLSSLIAGNDYLLQFDHANRTTGASGSFEVYWNNELIATINDTGTTMVTEEILLTAITGDNVLRFRGTGTEDQEGASLDNVRLMGEAALGEGWLPIDPIFPIVTGGGGGPVTTFANAEISQTISGRTAGEIMEIRFDHANRTTAASGSFEVYWNDVLIASIGSTGTTMQTKTYQVAAVAGNNTLRFKGTGTEDNFGASIDKVGVYATELVATGGNMDISQVVPGLAAGQAMQIQFDHANRTTGASGSFEVYWNGQLLEAINSTGTAMQTKTYNVTAIAGNNTLRFKGTGTVDAAGASIDNVRLFATQPDVGGGNMDVSQTVHALTAGQLMRLQFDHANRTSAASGSFEIWWNGDLVATIADTGAAMQSKSYDLVAVAGDNVLRFKSIGTVDAAGASIDNARLFSTQAVGGTGAGSLGAKLADVRPDATADDAWAWTVYDAASRPVQTIDGTGATTVYAYDGASRLVSIRSYANRLSAATLAALKTIAQPTLSLPAAHAADRVTRSFYNSHDQLIGTLDAEGYLTGIVYNQAGQKIETVAYSGATNEALRATGGFGQLLDSITIDDAGDIHEYSVYDARGLLRGEIDGEGNLTRYAYTPLGDVSEIVTGQKLDPAALLTTPPTLADLPIAPLGTVLETIAYTRSLYGQILTETRSLTAGTSTVTTYGYDKMRRLVSTSTQSDGPDSRTETRRYDARGRLVRTLSGIGSALLAALGPNPDEELSEPIWTEYGTLYDHDDADRLIARVDANGGRTLFYYDADDRLVYQVGALGEVVEYRYDSLGNRTDAITHAVRVDFETLSEMAGGDAASVAGVITALANSALDQASHVEFNVDGTIKQSTDALGELTTYTYNAFGDLIDQSDPFNPGTVIKTSFVYDRRGKVTTQIVDSAFGGKAVTTSYGYDAFGRAVQLTDPNSHATATAFDRAGRVKSTTDALNNLTSFAYDARGNLVAVTDALNHVTRYVYDHAGRQVFAVDALGGVVETSYDGDGRVLATRAYADTVSSAGWGLEIAAGDVIAELTASAGDRITRNAYDKDGRLKFVVDGVSGLSEYRYDDVGNAIRTIRYGWTVSPASTYTIDDLQAEVDAHAADPKRIAVAVYDLEGRLTFSVDATGNVTAFAYDSAGRVIKQVALATPYEAGDDPLNAVMQDWAANNAHADDRIGRAVYDRKGRLAYSIDGEGFVTEYRYNKRDGVVKEIRYADPYPVADGATVASVAAQIGSLPASAIVTDFVYDSAARLVETVDGLGMRTLMTLDQNGQILSTTLAYGSSDAVTNTRSYDALGRLLSESRADGTAEEQTTAYGYNALGDQVLITHAAGTSAERLTMLKYDGLGRLKGELSGIGSALIAALGPNPDEELVDPIWAEYGTQFGYDTAGRLTARSDANGARKLYYYDTADRLAYQIDAVGGVVEYRYNALGDRTETIRYAARIDSETLSEMAGGGAADAAGIVTALAGALLDGKTVSTYDAAGRLTLNTGQLGVYTAYAYNKFGEVKLRTTALGESATPGVATEIETSFAYDRRGKLQTEIVDSAIGGKAITTGHDYDAFGREIMFTDPNNHATATAYDRAGRVKSTTDALNNITSFAYDARGNLVAVTDALNHVTRYVYDRADRLIFSVDALGHVVETSHDGNDQVLVERTYAEPISLAGFGLQITAANITGQLATGPDDRITRNAYDKDGRLKFVVDGVSGLTEYRYDDVGNAIRTIRYGWTVSPAAAYTVDGLQAEVDAHAADPMRVMRAVHDAAGRTTFAIDATGNVTAFTYDAGGRVIKQVVLATAYETDDDPLNDVMQGWAGASVHADDRIGRAVYDRKGRLAYSIDGEGFVTEYRRNRSGDVILQIRYADPYPVADGATPATVAALLPSSIPPSAVTTEYFYDSAGRLEKTKDAIGTWTVMTLDQNGQIIATTLAHGTSDATTTTRGYDAIGRLETETRADGAAEESTTVYGYNALGDLVTITYAAGTADACVTTRTYDAAGRLETETRADGKAEEVTTAYGYNAFGDVESIRAASGTADEQLTTRIHDALGRLKSETVADGTAAEATTAYVYNVFGNVAKIIDPRLNSAHFYYDGRDRLVLQVDPEGYVTETVYGLGDEPMSVTRYATRVEGATLTAPPEIIADPDADATTIFQYDKLGRLTDITDAESHSEHYELDLLGNRTQVVNKLNGVTDNVYDRLGRLKTQYVHTNVHDWTGSLVATIVQTDFDYDLRGNLKTRTEGVGLGADQRVTGYAYDKLDRLIEIDRPDMASVTVSPFMIPFTMEMKDSFTYDRRGNLIASQVAGAPKTYAYYDGLDRKTDEIDESGMLSHWTYDANGNVEAHKVYGDAVAFAGTRPSAPPNPVNSANFRETHFTYDRANRLETSFGAALTTARWDGDSYDFATAAIVRHIEYDAAGNAIRDSVGDVETRSFYDKLGRKIAQLDAEHYLTVWELDAEGNLLVETRHATRVTGSIDQDASIEDLHAAAGSSVDDRITLFTYDRNGQRETETRLDVTVSTTAAGVLVTTLHGASQILYEYNGFGQVTRKLQANGDETLFTYDGFGRLTRTEAPGFADHLEANVRPTTDNLYDAFGNVVRTTLNDPSGPAADARVTSFIYNQMGWLASVTQQITATLSSTHSFTHDAGGRIVWDRYARRKSNGTNAPDSVTYTYDVSGRLLTQSIATRITTPPAVPKWSSGDVTRFKYNVYGDMTGRGINSGADGLPIYQETFDYDEGGRLWRSTEGGTGRIMFYDTLGNATLTLSSAGANVGALSFAAAKSSIEAMNGSGDTNIADAVTTIGMFDKRGQQTAAIEPDRQLIGGGGTVTITSSRTYNAFGETTSETDARNNSTDFFYNSMGRLIRKESPQVSWTDEYGTQANERPTELYFYDVSGRMVAVTDANGHTIRRNLLAGSGHDGTDALVTVEYHADNNKAQTLYDVFGNARIQRNEYWISGGTNDTTKTDVLMAYDKLGQLIEVQHLGRLLTETYTYDQLGQRTRHTMNALTETTDYDRQGRVISQVAFGGDTTTYSYAWDGALTTGALGNLGGWVKTTINAATLDATETLDYFNRTIARSDFGDDAYVHAYDWGGRMASLTGPGETLTYAYLNTGRIASISNGAGNSTAFGYDKSGNETSEVTHKSGQLIQNSTATWDALGRMSSWAETGTATLPAASILYEYDRVGNIRRQKASFQRLDGAGNPMGLLPTQDNWYRYDVMDRVTTDRGILIAVVAGELKTGDTARGIGTIQRQQPGVLTSLNRLGEIGYDYEYDAAGRRVSMAMSKVRYEGSFPQNAYFREHKEMYDYFADGSLSRVRQVDGTETGYANVYTISVPAASGTGTVLSDFTRDAFGRVTSQTDWVSASVRGYSRTGIIYNDMGQVTQETMSTLTTEGNANVLYVNLVDNVYGTGAGYALGAVIESTSTVQRNSSPHSTAVTTNTYDWRDGPVITRAEIHTERQLGATTDYATNYHYGASSELVSVDIDDGRPRDVNFINDMAGQVIRRDETGGTASGAPHEIWYRFGGKQMGQISNNGTLDNDYEQSLLYRQVWLGDSEALGAFRLGGNTPKTYADFSQSLDPINSYGQGGAGGAHTVRAGDTLQSIAASVWGDPDLWYKLAEANGLSGSSALVEGSSLTIPAGVLSNAHNDGTFRPYDAGKALGDLSPSAQKPPAKPGGCGMLGQFIVMAIALAITLIIKVPVAQFITAALKTAVGVGTALVGAAGAVAGAVVTGAVASAVSQGIGVATGLTDKFSWKGVALAGLSAGVAEGFAQAAGSIASSAARAAAAAEAPVSTVGRVAGYLSGSSIGGQIARGVITDAATQGIGVATGLQKKFDWAGIAANAVGTGIGVLAGQGLGRLGVDAIGIRVMSSLAEGTARAGARAAITGTSFGDNIIAALPGIIVNTMGMAVSDAIGANNAERAARRAAEGEIIIAKKTEEANAVFDKESEAELIMLAEAMAAARDPGAAMGFDYGPDPEDGFGLGVRFISDRPRRARAIPGLNPGDGALSLDPNVGTPRPVAAWRRDPPGWATRRVFDAIARDQNIDPRTATDEQIRDTIEPNVRKFLEYVRARDNPRGRQSIERGVTAWREAGRPGGEAEPAPRVDDATHRALEHLAASPVAPIGANIPPSVGGRALKDPRALALAAALVALTIILGELLGGDSPPDDSMPDDSTPDEAPLIPWRDLIFDPLDPFRHGPPGMEVFPRGWPFGGDAQPVTSGDAPPPANRTPAEKRQFMRDNGIGVAGQAGGSPTDPDDADDNYLPSDHELETAAYWRGNGDTVALRGGHRPGPDSIRNGVDWEIKQANGNSSTAIRDALRRAKDNFSNQRAIEQGVDPTQVRVHIDVRGSTRFNSPESINQEMARLAQPRYSTLNNVVEIEFRTSNGIIRWRPR